MPEHVAKRIRDFSAKIPDEKLAEDGREDDIHATVKYGLHDESHKSSRKALKGERAAHVRLGVMSLFKNEGADILKIEVHSPDLHRLNHKISKIPHTDTHPAYKPHITIAYLKPGEGKKYAGRPLPNITGKKVVVDFVRFSGKNRDIHDIPLKKDRGGEQ